MPEVTLESEQSGADPRAVQPQCRNKLIGEALAGGLLSPQGGWRECPVSDVRAESDLRPGSLDS